MSTSSAQGEFVVNSRVKQLLMSVQRDRKGKDYTYLYGAHVGTGSLTPYIESAFDERVDE